MNAFRHQPDISPARTRVLLERVATLYEKALADCGKARNWLRKHGIDNLELLASVRAGWCPGALNDILPADGGIRTELQTLGILQPDGTDRLANCLTFPIIGMEGGIEGIVGWNIGNSRPVLLPTLSRGVWNARAALHSDLVAMTTVIDGLIALACGHRNVIAICDLLHIDIGRLNVLSERRPRSIDFLATAKKQFDRLEPLLREAAGDECRLQFRRFPDGRSLASTVSENGLPQVRKWLTARRSRRPPRVRPSGNKVRPAPESPANPVPAPSDGVDVRLTLGSRQYEVLGLEKASRQLKGTVRVTAGGRFHVDALDLYSARSRRAMARDLAMVFEQPYDTMHADLLRLLRACETWRKQAAARPVMADPNAAMTAERKREAIAFGRRPDLIEMILADYETCGLVGERHNKLLCYLAAVSRKMDTPLSVLVLSSSGAGKSALQSTTLGLCPPEDVVQATSLTGRALFYQDEDALRHRILAVEEGVGMEASNYAVRTLISARSLSVEFVTRERGTGQLKTVTRHIPGPTSVFCTVTDPNIDAETRSRFFVLGVDETREQTERILMLQRERHTLEGLMGSFETENVRRKHQDFQRLLRLLAVVNPYARELLYGDDRLQARRDQPKYLNLIRTVAFLRQMGREVKRCGDAGRPVEYIEVELSDIEVAHAVFTEIYGTTLDELSRPARDLLDLLCTFLADKADGIAGGPCSGRPVFTRREVRERSGWHRTRLHRHLNELIDLEYVVRAAHAPGDLPAYRLLYAGEGLSGERFKPGICLPTIRGRPNGTVPATRLQSDPTPITPRFGGGADAHEPLTI